MIQILYLLSLIGFIIFIIWFFVLYVGSFKEQYENRANGSKDLPNLVLLMPVMNEHEVIENTLTKLNAIIKSVSNIYLIVINDGSNDGTQEIIEHMKLDPKISLINRVLPNAQTGKGDALNFAFDHIKQQFDRKDAQNVVIGILDADAEIHKDDLIALQREFQKSPQLDLVQIKVAMKNSHSWLEKMQDIDFIVINDMIQSLRNHLLNSAASGNGQFVRLRSIMGIAKPWGNSLLEDFEFSTRMLLRGGKTVYDSKIVVWQEAVSQLKPFVIQRARWVQGGIECIGKYGWSIIKSKSLKFYAKVEMLFYMFLPFVSSITAIASLIVMFLSLLNFDRYFFLFLLLLGINSLVTFILANKYRLAQNSRNLVKYFLFTATLFFYNFILLGAVLLAFYRLITKQTSWAKTTHKVSK